MRARAQAHPVRLRRPLAAARRSPLAPRAVEGTCSGRNGYIINVNSVDTIGDGVLSEGKGHADFAVEFKAVVFYPFRNETLEGRVTRVHDRGFHVDVGPMTVFVTRHSIPSEFYFDANAVVPQWANTNDATLSIAPQEKVRLRLQGVRREATELSATGTIDDAYLGPVQ